MKLNDLTNKHLSRLPKSASGYPLERLSKMTGEFDAYFDGTKVAGPLPAYDAATKLQTYITNRYPDVNLPLLFHPEENSNNLSVSDSVGEYMGAELWQL